MTTRQSTSACVLLDGFPHNLEERASIPKIRNPCEDTCGECTKIQNRFHLLEKIGRSVNCKSATNNNPSSSNEDEEKSITSSCFSGENDIDELQFLSTTEYPIEAVLMDATEHTVNAQNQRLLADSQIDEAKATAALPWENRR